MRLGTILALLLGLTVCCPAEEFVGDSETAVGPGTRAAESQRTTPLSKGEMLPPFECRTHLGNVWKSDDHLGSRFLVVYFFPAAFTSRCTGQACDYRDHLTEFKAAGIDVVGVSGDQESAQRLFAQHYELKFPLLPDGEGRIARLFGVPLRKGNTIICTVDGVSLALKRRVTASRWTFVIDRQGRVVTRIPAVGVGKDAGSILEIVKRLSGASES